MQERLPRVELFIRSSKGEQDTTQLFTTHIEQFLRRTPTGSSLIFLDGTGVTPEVAANVSRASVEFGYCPTAAIMAGVDKRFDPTTIDPVWIPMLQTGSHDFITSLRERTLGSDTNTVVLLTMLDLLHATYKEADGTPRVYIGCEVLDSTLEGVATYAEQEILIEQMLIDGYFFDAFDAYRYAMSQIAHWMVDHDTRFVDQLQEHVSMMHDHALPIQYVASMYRPISGLAGLLERHGYDSHRYILHGNSDIYHPIDQKVLRRLVTQPEVPMRQSEWWDGFLIYTLRVAARSARHHWSESQQYHEVLSLYYSVQAAPDRAVYFWSIAQLKGIKDSYELLVQSLFGENA